jgi:hypothetical protein
MEQVQKQSLNLPQTTFLVQIAEIVTTPERDREVAEPFDDSGVLADVKEQEDPIPRHSIPRHWNQT